MAPISAKVTRRVATVLLPRLSQDTKRLIQVILDDELFGTSLAWTLLPSGSKEPQHLPWYLLQHLQKESGFASPTTRVESKGKRLLNGQQELWIMRDSCCTTQVYTWEKSARKLLMCLKFKFVVHGFTHKKIQLVASRRSSGYRAAFVSEALTFHANKFVWVDEMGCGIKCAK